jgi:hypothetical protein
VNKERWKGILRLTTAVEFSIIFLCSHTIINIQVKFPYKLYLLPFCKRRRCVVVISVKNYSFFIKRQTTMNIIQAWKFIILNFSSSFIVFYWLFILMEINWIIEYQKTASESICLSFFLRYFNRWKIEFSIKSNYKFSALYNDISC